MSGSYKRPRRLDQHDHSGRVDVAAAKVLRQAAIEMSDNPLAQLLYKVFRPEIETALTKKLGPSGKTARQLKRSVTQAVRMREELTRRLSEEL